MTEHVYEGGCHCGAIHVELRTPRAPADQIVGVCQCSFCRKHNARTFSDPKSSVTLTAREPRGWQGYRFGLGTAEAIVCRQCGVYVAMVLTEAGAAWSTINLDTLGDRAAFTRPAQPRDYSGEDARERVARRKSRWCPTRLVGVP